MRPDQTIPALLRGGSPNVQFQMNSNPFSPPRSASGMLYNPMINAQPNFDNGSPFSPRYYPAPNQQVPVQSAAPQPQRQRDPDTPMKEDGKKEDQINTSPDKEDPTSVPFGTRIQSQGGREGQSDFPSQRDVYIRYPISEAGYATEESLPVQNTTTKSDTNGDSPTRAVFPFFQHPGPFPGYNGPDPYRNALNAVQPGFPIDSNAQSSDDNNSTKFIQPDQFIQNVPYPFNQPPGSQRQPGALFSGYSGGNPSLFQTSDDDGAGNPFDQMTLFPDSNYRFPTPLQARAPTPDSNKTPACAQENNASICFDDPEYPRRDVSFALNSDSFVMNRFAMPDQQLDAMSLIEDKLQDPKKPNDFICNSDIKYGMPLRAKDVKGKWKVIVNMDKNTGGGRFTQPVRLEVCKNAGEQCNFTQVKTACVQKFSLHRLLSWSPDKGIHNDVFKLPVACSCQLLDAQE
ncbi:neurotrophin 1 [Caerostris darwini]|uniref:Neurotrophin 1 n=1 Tax=Caerostris darwini TaxID=1538125 RepID=A0AAV4RPE7_9ARAC|nr:neurotrophin 1 [Caerostris darwini]